MHKERPVSVLVAPLDWGLGHATRCIPVIKQLDQQGARVIIAASGTQKMLLKQEFPGLEFLDIPGYSIKYKPGILLKWGLILQIPAILKQIKRENEWLEEIRHRYSLDAVISDNRFGLYNKNLSCVFITHQLYVQSGWSRVKKVGGWIDRIILKWNYRFIEKFSECWVPDEDGESSLAGKLSHPPIMPKTAVKYIGILSRFERREIPIIKNSLLILLSGPEPQRTSFENILVSQLKGTTRPTLILRGLPGEETSIPFKMEGVKILNHLPARELNQVMSESDFIIARGGYSTIMDLVQLKKKAIIVPTPGQTEQEYLGRYLHEKNWFYSIPQKNLNLEAALMAFQKTEWRLAENSNSVLQNTVGDFLGNIQAGL